LLNEANHRSEERRRGNSGKSILYDLSADQGAQELHSQPLQFPI